MQQSYTQHKSSGLFLPEGFDRRIKRECSPLRQWDMPGGVGAVPSTVVAGGGGGGGGGAVWRGNEPAGFTQVHDTDYTSANPTGWGSFSGQQQVVNDATAPKSPPSCLVYDFPSGFGGGSSPGSQDSNGGNNNFNAPEMYFCTYLKYSSNWYGHPSLVNKQFHGWTGEFGGGNYGNKMVISCWGDGNNTLVPTITFQGIVSGGNTGGGTSGNYQGNSTPYTRGAWHLIECHAKKNTPNNNDGDVKLWFDGVLTSHATGIQITPTELNWGMLQISLIWGGTGSSVPADQYARIDHMYLAKK